MYLTPYTKNFAGTDLSKAAAGVAGVGKRPLVITK